MANSIIEMIMGQLGGDTLAQLGAKTGLNESEARTGVQAAVPVLLGAMERNAGDEAGAQALKGALERDHDGSILDNIGGFLGGGDAAGNGAGILKHILGDRRPAVEQQLSKQTGLGTGPLGKLLELVAPLVMGALGKLQSGTGLDIGQLSGFLGGQREQSEQSAGLLGIASSLLDADKDGDVLDDLGGIAGKLFGR